MKLSLYFYLAIVALALTCCTSAKNSPQPQTDTVRAAPSQQVVTLDEKFKVAMGQTIYVPVYSHIYHDDRQQTFNLAATLSIRNTDLTNPIVIASVRYYDSNGKLVRQYLERPIQLAALASTDFFIDATDTSGGLGAKFIVEWVAQSQAQKLLFEPVIEAVMIGSGFHQGISFISPGKVIKSVSRKQQSTKTKSISAAVPASHYDKFSSNFFKIPTYPLSLRAGL